MVYDVVHYRELAARCRLLAKGATTKAVVTSLLEMAEDFDAEAERLGKQPGQPARS